MKKLLAFILQPPIPALAGLVLLSAVIYYGGRALHRWIGLSDSTLLMIVIGVWVLAALVFVWRRFQSSKRARLIEDRLRGQAREHKESVRPDKRSQVEELEKQLGTALSTLKTSKLGKNALYELPWYVIIGPPGSGKTTLLRESNLTFPDQAHGRGVRGVGGTRNCDWWFTDQGILLDTAGRYTTQDEDRKEWFSFLDMLKKSRARKPINGAMIAISIADIIQSTEEQLAEHARKIRERLAELTQRLEVVFPVYLLFSKCDLLEGFVETFGGYGSKERAQLWGFTLPYLKSNDKSIAQQFDTEIDALQDRLGAERLHNLGAAKSKSKKAKIFSFPMQFAMVRERLRSFLTQLEQPNPYHESSDLRGFYFTSGTQEGQPLDQVLANMRAACGLTEDNESAVEEQTDKKAYFIDDLFTDVVFPDKELARSSAKAEKRGQLMRRIGMIATGAATLALLVLLVVGYVGQSSLIDRSMQAHEAANIDFTADELQRETTLAEDGGGPFEKLRVLFEELDDAHDSMGSYIIGQQNALYSRRVRKLYIKQLKTTLLAPLQARLKQQLEDGIKQSSEELNVILLKDVLTGYQMVGGKIAFDREWMKEFLLGDRWTWRKGEEILAGLAHRTTFLERVATATTTDWQVEAEEGLVRDSKMKWRKNSGVAKTVDKLRDESGETAPVPIDIMLTHPDANLVENSAVLECYVNETSLDSAFAKEAERNADETLDSLKERDRKDAIKAWRDSLFTLAPKQRLNLKEACERVRKLTSEPAGSFYVRYYELVSERLVRLGEDCSSPDDQAWLPDTLTAIGAVAEAAKPITNLTSTKRIIPSIGSNLDALTGKIAEARSTIGLRSKEAPVAIQSHIATALSNLLESVTTALAYEIVTQANQEWSQGVGKKLGTFSTQFPFTDSEEGVDPGEFQTMFADDGDFATALTEWVLPLEGYLGLLSLDREFDDHTLDRVKIDDIRKALFGVTVGCEIDFVLVKPNKTRSVTFQLGKQEPITAKRRTRKTLTWTPSDTVMIRINGFELAGPGTGVDSTKEELDTWGFLRLLSHGSRNPATFEMDSVEYQMCVWSDFKTNGESLTAGDTPASMTILFKTSAKPNPLNQDFFKHKFSHNKVFKNTEETDGK